MSKVINLISVNLKTIINVTVSFVSISLIIRYLGVEQYSEIAVILSFMAAFNLLGNSIVDASIKNVLRFKENNDDNSINQYLSSVAFVLFILFLISITVAITLSLTNFRLVNLDNQFWFIFLFILVTFGNLTSGIYRVGAFVAESFSAPSFISSISRLTYIVALFLGLAYWNNIWVIPLSNVLAMAVLILLMYRNFKFFLPDNYLKFEYISIKAIPEIFSSIGFMVLVYIGIYLTSSSILIIAKIYELDNRLIVILALAISIGSIAGNLLTSFTYIGIPKIHKYLSSNKQKEAVAVVHKIGMIVGVLLFWGIVILKFEGRGILQLWLNEPIKNEELNVILASVFSFGLSAIGVLVSHFCSAKNLIRHYGYTCLVEGFFAIILIFILFKYYDGNLAIFLSVLLPGVLYCFKFVFVKYSITKIYSLDLKEKFSLIWKCLFLFLVLFIVNLCLNENFLFRLFLEIILTLILLKILIKSIKYI